MEIHRSFIMFIFIANVIFECTVAGYIDRNTFILRDKNSSTIAELFSKGEVLSQLTL